MESIKIGIGNRIVQEPNTSYERYREYRLSKLMQMAKESMEDDWITGDGGYVAWLRWNGHTYETCDSDDDGAFKVYRHAGDIEHE